MNAEHDPEFDQQILIRLNEAWEDATGIDDFPLHAETTLTQMMEAYEGDPPFAWLSDSLDLMDLCFRLEHEFCMIVTRDDWITLFGGDETRTPAEWQLFRREWVIQDLIDFIRVRISKVSFEPVNICGKDCAPAGAFFGLRDLVRHHLKSDIRMGPSSRIDEIVDRHHFAAFWKHVRLFTRNRPPQLIPRSRYPREIFRFGYYWLLFYEKVISIGLLFAVAGVNWLWLIIPSAFANWIHWTILKDPDYGFLPDDIKTFRDLAEYIAKQPAFT